MTEFATGGIVSAGQTHVALGELGCALAYPVRRRETWWIGEDGPEVFVPVTIAVDVGRVGVEVDVPPVVQAAAERLDRQLELPPAAQV